MKLRTCTSLLLGMAALLPALAPAQVTFQGKEGPGKGKKVVLLAGDEEYRSEEVMPMLAQILAEKHGFDATVVWSINPKGWTQREIAEFKKANKDAPEPKADDPDPRDGTIDPNEPANNPGLEALKDADLCILLLRFRKWPEEQMKHFAEYYNAGKPFIALRTSTHAFNGVPAPYQSFNSFGKQVLGEGWISHWGKHKAEATRGVIEPGAEGNPLLIGVKDVFGDTDVYEAYPPADAKILLRGVVLKGMSADSEPAAYEKVRATDKGKQDVNTPTMPVAWTREYKNEAGTVNQILTTTMGSGSDLKNEDLRRLIVNAAYQFTGLPVPEKADVAIVGDFPATMYGFNGYIKGVKPETVKDGGFSKALENAKK